MEETNSIASEVEVKLLKLDVDKFADYKVLHLLFFVCNHLVHVLNQRQGPCILGVDFLKKNVHFDEYAYYKKRIEYRK